jgi:hypothetical protein
MGIFICTGSDFINKLLFPFQALLFGLGQRDLKMKIKIKSLFVKCQQLTFLETFSFRHFIAVTIEEIDAQINGKFSFLFSTSNVGKSFSPVVSFEPRATYDSGNTGIS